LSLPPRLFVGWRLGGRHLLRLAEHLSRLDPELEK
jgi:hypothetical protein